MLQAMNTGHDGSISTLHANTPRDALARLETMVLMAGMDLPVRAIREQVASAVDLIIQQTRLKDGTRRITAITEIVGMEGDIITTQDVFLFDYAAGVDENGQVQGRAASRWACDRASSSASPTTACTSTPPSSPPAEPCDERTYAPRVARRLRPWPSAASWPSRPRAGQRRRRDHHRPRRDRRRQRRRWCSPSTASRRARPPTPTSVEVDGRRRARSTSTAKTDRRRRRRAHHRARARREQQHAPGRQVRRRHRCGRRLPRPRLPRTSRIGLVHLRRRRRRGHRAHDRPRRRRAPRLRGITLRKGTSGLRRHGRRASSWSGPRGHARSWSCPTARDTEQRRRPWTS